MRTHLFLQIASLFTFYTLPIYCQTYFNETYPPPEGQQSNILNIGETHYGYLVVGLAFGFPTQDVFLTAVSKEGVVLWENDFMLPDQHLFLARESFFPLPDHSFITAGSGPAIDDSQRIIYTLKVSEIGDVIWSKIIKQSPRFISALNGTPSADGNYVFCGQSREIDTASSDCLLIKINTDGDLLWERIIGGPGFQSGESIARTTDGGFAVGGSNRTGTYRQIMVLKTDAEGNELWRKFIGGNYDQPEFKFITALGNGDILVGTAARASSSFTDFDAFAARYSSSGTLLWQRRYNHEWNNSFFTKGLELEDGSIVMGGYRGVLVETDSFQTVSRFTTFTRISPEGDVIWDRILYINEIGVNVIYGFIPTEDNGYLGYGFATDPTQRAWVIKLDEWGCNAPGCAPVVGASSPPGEVSTPTLAAYPNPFQDQLRLEYRLPPGVAHARLQFCDSQGRRLLDTPIIEGAPAGDVVWAPGSLVPGIYIATLSAQGYAPVSVKVVGK